jgi:hypothetical protein
MTRAPRDPERAKRWPTFLRNHREATAAMGFFSVPKIIFGALLFFRHQSRSSAHPALQMSPSIEVRHL